MIYLVMPIEEQLLFDCWIDGKKAFVFYPI